MARGLIVNVANPRDWCRRMWDHYGFDYDLQSITEHTVFVWSYYETNRQLLEDLTRDGIKASAVTRRL